jgi:predicted Zn-dependent protease
MNMNCRASECLPAGLDAIIRPTANSFFDMRLALELRKVGFALVATMALTHCAPSPVSGVKDGLFLSGKLNIRQDAHAHEEVLARYGMVDNALLQALVTRVGKVLAANSRRPDLDWHFTVLDRPEVDAFSLPGGYVYVTRGILAYLNSEAELAAILAHEIGHITAGHVPRQQTTLATTGLPETLDAILLTGAAGRSSPHDLAMPWRIDYGVDNELEADRLGVRYLSKVGYSPQAMVEVMAALNRQALFDAELARREGREPDHYHGALAALSVNDRPLKQAASMAAQRQGAVPGRNRDEFLQLMNGIQFGDGFMRHVIRNNALLHEGLGIALQFPQGWKVQDSTNHADATNPQHDAMMRVLSGPNVDKPEDAVRKGLRLDPGARFESGSINACPAGFAAGAHQGKPVLAAAINCDGSQTLIVGLTRDASSYQRNGQAIKNAINSFRAKTASERKHARAPVIRIIAAQSGTTMNRLAANSPLGPPTESYLRLMNHLYPDGEPSPGQLLKVLN